MADGQDKKEDTRGMLLRMTKGGMQCYYIRYSVDIKGNITIWGGEPLDKSATKDMLLYCATEDYLHLYDRGKHGRDMVQKEKENAEGVPRETLVAAYLNFRKEHPQDGWGFHSLHMANEEGDSSRRLHRDDKDEVKQELRRRNRQYIAELYGEHLPVDFDFYADYVKRLELQHNAR